MGLLDSVSSIANGVLGEGNHSGLLGAVGSLINNPQTGGIAGLIKTFEEKGLGGVAASWVSSGQNLPISAEQIQSVLGNERVAEVAQKLGIPPDQMAAHLSQLLPQVVDKLTPNGSLPASTEGWEQALGGLLQGLGK